MNNTATTELPSDPPVRSMRLLGVVVETAKVYKANGRRFLTKRAACRALAKQIINQRCECEPDHRWGDGSCDLTPGVTCWYHKDPERLEKIIRRMARIIMHAKTPNSVITNQVAKATNPTGN